MKENLWIDLSDNSYFLIPDNAVVPTGSYHLIALSREKLTVDLPSIENWRVSQQMAEEHLRTQFQFFFDDLQDILKDVFGDRHSEANDAPVQATDLLTQLTGIDPETVYDNPEIARQQIERFVNQLADTLSHTFGGELNEAENSVARLSKQLQSAGLEFNHTRLEALPQKLHDWYVTSDQPEQFHQVVTMLRTFAKADQTDNSNWLDLIAHWWKLLDEVREEETKVDYYEQGRQAVHDNLKVPTFDFKQMWAAHQQNK